MAWWCIETVMAHYFTSQHCRFNWPINLIHMTAPTLSVISLLLKYSTTHTALFLMHKWNERTGTWKKSFRYTDWPTIQSELAINVGIDCPRKAISTVGPSAWCSQENLKQNQEQAMKWYQPGSTILITVWERLNLMETYSSTAFSLCWEYFWLPSRVHTLMVTNIIVDTLTGLLAATTDHNHYVSWALFTTV